MKAPVGEQFLPDIGVEKLGGAPQKWSPKSGDRPAGKRVRIGPAGRKRRRHGTPRASTTPVARPAPCRRLCARRGSGMLFPDVQRPPPKGGRHLKKLDNRPHTAAAGAARSCQAAGPRACRAGACSADGTAGTRRRPRRSSAGGPAPQDLGNGTHHCRFCDRAGTRDFTDFLISAYPECGRLAASPGSAAYHGSKKIRVPQGDE